MQSPYAQPYAQQNVATRAPGGALTAMLAGRTLHGFNPQDQQRQYGALVQLLMQGALRR